MPDGAGRGRATVDKYRAGEAERGRVERGGTGQGVVEEAGVDGDDLVVAGNGAGVGEGDGLKSNEASLAALRFLPMKLMSFTGAY